MRDIPEEDLVFIDETGFWVGMSRRYARSLKGRRAYHFRRFYKGRKVTLIGAIDINGMVASKQIEGSMKGKDFYQFVKDDLVPQLRKGHVVVMDNLRAHKIKGIEELIKSKGARIEYLPPHSPDYNPIEMLWSSLKAFICRQPSHSLEMLNLLIALALWWMEISFFRHWFVKGCYCAK